MLRSRGWRGGDAGFLTAHFGRRGIILGLLGMIWTFIGYGLATISQQRFSADMQGGALQYLDDQTPLLGGIWAVGGIAAIVAAFARNRYPRDDYGFIGLSVPVFVTSALYFWSWAAAVFSADIYGRPNAWLAGAVYAVVLVVILFVARWPDPDDPHLRVDDEKDGGPAR